LDDFYLVRQHILGCIRAAMSESVGDSKGAERLRAQGNLRLLIMSDKELKELARVLSYLPSRPQEVVYRDLKKAVKEHKKNADEWIHSLGVEPEKRV